MSGRIKVKATQEEMDGFFDEYYGVRCVERISNPSVGRATFVCYIDHPDTGSPLFEEDHTYGIRTVRERIMDAYKAEELSYPEE